ncbi:MAG: hypothetical protein KA254_04545 [Rhodoferax sp.]|nr:hypothetical protein [Rhodoferax sp.]
MDHAHYKNDVSRKREPVLLPHLDLAAETGGSFNRWAKIVCFWQRSEGAKSGKTFAGQGAY